ncbi:hypothetical protein DFH09DRAFT_1454525 [Mycena vulgaris]|nr:hypothetical protein DFH09DRAFT_1454525 [Mycena vulgaris]
MPTPTTSRSGSSSSRAHAATGHAHCTPGQSRARHPRARPRGRPRTSADAARAPRREAHLILNGPYGGLTLHAGDYARVLLLAGGSGATFTLGVLDRARGARDAAAWRGVLSSFFCISACDANAPRSSLRAINWFAPYLLQIATCTALPGPLSIRIYVMCLCDPDAVPAIPGCVVTEARLHLDVMLAGLLGGGAANEKEDEDGGKHKSEASSASVEALPAKATRMAKPLRTRRKATGSGRTRTGAGWG